MADAADFRRPPSLIFTSFSPLFAKIGKGAAQPGKLGELGAIGGETAPRLGGLSAGFVCGVLPEG
jgi:hypothetical protein